MFTTVKPPIIPGGREQQKANKERMETGGVSWQRGQPDITG